MRILVTPTFERTVKKLHGQQKADVDAAVKAVANNISISEEKMGDFVRACVHKFRMVSQLCLLSYRVLGTSSIKILTVGTHEISTVI
jgi:mRNA interferase RelE/StbE